MSSTLQRIGDRYEIGQPIGGGATGRVDGRERSGVGRFWRFGRHSG
jgi:hypothetical protein